MIAQAENPHITFSTPIDWVLLATPIQIFLPTGTRALPTVPISCANRIMKNLNLTLATIHSGGTSA